MRILSICLLLSTTLNAQTIFYPGVASSPGANDTRWRTEVTLHNPSDAIKEAVLSIQSFGSAAASFSKEFRLGGFETLGIDDLYFDLGAGTGAGVLKVEGPVLAWVRTYNQGEGTFGQNIPPVNPAIGYAPGEKVHFPIRMPASAATDFRSNLLLFNLSNSTVHFTLASGTATAPAQLEAGTATLILNPGAAIGLPPGPAPLTVSADGRWMGFVSTVDPFMGDPTTVLGLTAPANEGLRFPGVASAPGANQTEWRSELELFNARAGTSSVTLSLTPFGTAQAAPPVNYPIGAGELVLVEDVYALFGQEPGAGVLLVEGAVLAWVRTFNLGDGGTFGQNIPPHPVGAAFPSGQARLFPLRTQRNIGTDFRSNLLILNPGDSPLHFLLDAGDAPSYPVELPAGMTLLLDSIGDTMSLPPGLSTLSVSADGPWSGFISTVDPALGDPTTIEGLPAPCTPPTVAVSGPAEACRNDSLEYTADYPSQAEVSWIVAGGTIQSGQGTAAIRVLAGAAGTCTATAVVTLSGCTASAGATTLVRALPGAAVSGTATICPGQSATLRADLTGSRPFDLTWSDGVIQTGVTTPATRLASPAATTTYTVTVVTDNWCTGTGSGSAVITVDAEPSVSGLAASPGTIPMNGTATIAFTVAGAQNWTLASAFGNTIAPETGATNGVLNAAYTADAAFGADTITLTATNACVTVQTTTAIEVTP